jgi:hypothetical protein
VVTRNKKLKAHRKQQDSAREASQDAQLSVMRKQLAQLTKLVGQQQGMLDAIALHLRELPNNDSFVACLVARMNDMMLAAEQKARDTLNGIVTEPRFKLVNDEDIAGLPRDALLLKVAMIPVPATEDAPESTRVQISAREYNIEGNWAFFEVDDSILERLEITGAQVIEAAGSELPAILHLTYEKVQKAVTQAGAELADLEGMADDADFQASPIEALIEIDPITPEEEAILASISGERTAGDQRYHETITGIRPTENTNYVIVKSAANGPMAVYDHTTRQATLSDSQLTFFTHLLDNVFNALPEREVIEFYVIHTPIAEESAANDEIFQTTVDSEIAAETPAAVETVTETAPAVQ